METSWLQHERHEAPAQSWSCGAEENKNLLLFLQQTLRSPSWAPACALEGFRFITRGPGEPSVMTTGTWTMPLWSADRWAAAPHSAPQPWRSLVQEADRSGSMMSAAQGVKAVWTVVPTILWGNMTVHIVRMLEWFVKVRTRSPYSDCTGPCEDM